MTAAGWCACCGAPQSYFTPEPCPHCGGHSAMLNACAPHPMDPARQSWPAGKPRFGAEWTAYLRQEFASAGIRAATAAHGSTGATRAYHAAEARRLANALMQLPYDGSGDNATREVTR